MDALATMRIVGKRHEYTYNHTGVKRPRPLLLAWDSINLGDSYASKDFRVNCCAKCLANDRRSRGNPQFAQLMNGERVGR